MKALLLRYNQEPLEININDVARVVPNSYTIYVCFKNGTKIAGMMLKFVDD